MSSTVGDVSSVIPSASDVPYSVIANVTDGGVDVSSSTTTGGAATATGATATPTATKELGKDDFLKLLITQLQYQDPLNPMDNTQFISQMAQFSALEGTNNLEKSVSDIDTLLQKSIASQNQGSGSMSSASAISLIGKNVRVRQSQVTFSQGANETVGIKVNALAGSAVTADICSADGSVVKTLSGTAGTDGVAFLTWDGSLDSGGLAPAGNYSITIPGSSTNPSLYAFVDGQVNGVSTLAGGTQIRIAGVPYNLSDVVDVSEPAS